MSQQTEVPTYRVTIWVGFKEGYEGPIHSVYEVAQILDEWCQRGLCVTATPTRFHYKDGWEDGVAIGLINYPRFPSSPEELFDQALELAHHLKDRLGQNRVTIVADDRTVMLGES